MFFIALSPWEATKINMLWIPGHEGRGNVVY